MNSSPSASQQAEMDEWDIADTVLPEVPPAYFTGGAAFSADVPVTPSLKSTFGLPDGINTIDMLTCQSAVHAEGDVSAGVCGVRLRRGLVLRRASRV